MQKLDNELWNIEEARGSRDGFYKNIENIMDGDENKQWGIEICMC